MRTVLYALVAGILASALFFYKLSDDSMWGDESLYSLCVDNMIAGTSDWLTPTPYPPDPYFQKPPLQMWLTALTYHWTGDITRYRVWSAAFGVGTILLTVWIGARLITPEVGLLAALFLMTNKRILLNHGVRSGAFDAGLMFFTLSAIAGYLMTHSFRRKWVGWLIVGVSTGLASLLKPAGGLPILLILFVHTLVANMGTRRRQVEFASTIPQIDQKNRTWGRFPVHGFLLTIVITIVVASPWYVGQLYRFGGQFISEMRGTVVDRALTGLDQRHVEPWYFYFRTLTLSSEVFRVALPAILLSVLASFLGTRQWQMRLLSIAIVGWLIGFSLSHSKMLHYAYPIYPLVAIAIAELIRVAIVFVTNRIAQSRGHVVQPVVVVAIVAVLIWRCWNLASITYEKEKRIYEPYAIYQSMLPEIQSGQREVLITGIEEATRAGLIDMRDRFYLNRIPATKRVDTHDATKPALILIGKNVDGQAIMPVGGELVSSRPGFEVRRRD